jgi:hypothetical protein
MELPRSVGLGPTKGRGNLFETLCYSPLAGQRWAGAMRSNPAENCGMRLASLQCRQVSLSPTRLDDIGQETFPMARSRYPTLLDLTQAVSEIATSDQEMLARVADLINSGKVRLCGDSAGATIDLLATEDAPA